MTTKSEDIAAFKKEVRELFVEEAACEVCQEVRRSNPMVSDELKARVADPDASGQMPPCAMHKRERLLLGVYSMKSWS